MEPAARARLAHDCRTIDPEPIADLAMDLLEIWSPPAGEAAVAQRLVEALEAESIPVRLDEEYPGSPTVIANLGQPGVPTVQWHGHLDAIDVPHPPPTRRDGMLFGRGAADMKGGLAAMVAAAGILRRHDLPLRGGVLVTLHGMHESGGNEPLHALIRRGIHGDAALIGELGGGASLPIAGLGLTLWEIVVDGQGPSVHETNAGPERTDSLEVGRLLHDRLAALRDRLANERGVEPKPSLFIGRFVAGDYFNRVAVRCELAGTRRHDESSNLAAVAGELRSLVEEVRTSSGASVELRTAAAAESYHLDPEEPIVVATRAAHLDLTGQELPVSRSRAVGNAETFTREAGIPAVYYGTDYSTAHSDQEQVTFDDLARVAGGFALATTHYLEGRTGAAP